MTTVKTMTNVSNEDYRDEFDELVRRHHKQAYNVAYRIAGNHADAEDLVQEAFMRAYRFFGQYKREMPFESWLYKIMSNAFIDMLRKRPKVQIRSLDKPVETDDGEASFEVPDKGPTPEEQTMANETQSEIKKALDELPEMFRMAVIYADIEGLSYEEIAEVMNCNIGTVRSRIHRGRKLLKDKLTGREGFDLG
ncbi:MAG: sigma-70 family RNA polymerase sigma factor [Abditibacteriota bacterium]|nr:sigma-70 family RNA polymerase sigma factor [Abditibacteriota bacterium]MBP5717966.1 sigma-70 family RNA polymerase sigma factor [Abditibacteriota bacterium]